MNETDLIYVSLILFTLTLICSWIGDDDVAYAIFGRKPTPHEAIARIRYVLAKAFASIYGGGLTTLLFAQYVLKGLLLLHVSKLQFVCLLGPCTAIFGLFIGVVQNVIRHIQGRQTRPIYDVVLLKYNLGLWRKWFRGQGRL